MTDSHTPSNDSPAVRASGEPQADWKVQLCDLLGRQGVEVNGVDEAAQQIYEEHVAFIEGLLAASPSDAGAAPQAAERPQEEFRVRVLRRVAELPDRTSPEDWPDAMLVTYDELRQILIEELAGSIPEGETPQ